VSRRSTSRSRTATCTPRSKWVDIADLDAVADLLAAIADGAGGDTTPFAVDV